MADLRRACKKAVDTGKAERVSETAFLFVARANLNKLASVQQSYSKAFHKRWRARVTKEQEAEKHLHDFVITY